MVSRRAGNSRVITQGRVKSEFADRLVFFVSLAALVAASVLGGCSFTEVNEEETTPEKVVLVDLTGKEWDITSAVWRYGFEVERFEFGLGPRAIRPLIEPNMLSPGDFGYPGEDAPFLVIGAAIDGDIRAYGKLDLTVNEVVDEYIGGAPVAVAY